MNKTPPPVRERNPTVPAELERIIGKLLEKDRGLRYASAAELREHLERLQAGSNSAAPRTRVSPARVRLRTAVTIAAILMILAAAGWYFWRMRASRNIDSLAVLPFVNAAGSPDAEYLSDGITESLMAFPSCPT